MVYFQPAEDIFYIKHLHKNERVRFYCIDWLKQAAWASCLGLQGPKYLSLQSHAPAILPQMSGITVPASPNVFGTRPCELVLPWLLQPCERQPKAIKTQLSQGRPSGLEYTQIRWFSWWSGRSLDLVSGGQRRSRKSWKTTLRKPRGPSQKTGILTA